MLIDGDLAKVPIRALALSTANATELLEGAISCGANLRVVSTASELEDALSSRPQLVLIDDGLLTPALVEAVRVAIPCVVAALVDADPDPETITRALAAGVDTIALRHAAQLRRLFAQEASRPAPGARPPQLPSAIVGTSAPMREVWRMVLLAARTDVSVLVTGETGAGKELVAQALHRLSPRRSGPFVAVNCAALPESLLESELFGHEKGSFTGAATRHKGRFELAHGGTLFLDEIGDLPPNVQAKLLRVLQERTFERVGGTESLSVDVRVVAATHRELHSEIHRAGFRADLFYRLNVLSIHVPPLRERKADVPALWEHFLDSGAPSKPALETSVEVKRRLISHDWPGNVRELYNVAQHVGTVRRSSTIGLGDLPPYLANAGAPPPDSLKSLVGLTMKQVERAMIRETLQVAGTVRGTAEMLGLSVRTVHYRLREYRSEQQQSAVADCVTPATVRPRSRVFVAEDNDEQRVLLTSFLRSVGYEVVDVSDGTALLREIGSALIRPREDRALPDLVVSDVCMPGATGLQFLEGIRAQGSQLPVVLVTGFGDAAARERARALGATAILDKPLDLVALEGIIREALAS